jgi:hypothetical protein
MSWPRWKFAAALGKAGLESVHVGDKAVDEHPAATAVELASSQGL